MKDYIKALRLAFSYSKGSFLLYLFLCLIEVIKNVAYLLSVYWGVTFIEIGGAESWNGVLWSIVLIVLSEIGGILVNISMNHMEKRIELSAYQDVLTSASEVPLLCLSQNRFQSLVRDLLDEGTGAITQIAVDFSSYVTFFCNILLFTVLTIRSGILFVIIALVSMFAVQLFLHKNEENQEHEWLTLSRDRSKRKYYVDLLDSEKNHVQIVANNGTEFFQQKMGEASRSFAKQSNRVRRNILRYKLLSGLIVGSGFVLTGIVLIVQLNQNVLPVQFFIVTVLAVVLLYTEMGTLLSTLIWDKEALHYVKGFFELRSMRTPSWQSELERIHSIELDGVSFSYGDKKAVDEVSAKFRAGEVVMLVGENGAGKTTFLTMLSGLFQPDNGSIRYNHDQSIPPEMILKQVAYVSQQSPMLTLTIKESFFSNQCSAEAMERALRQVGLLDKILQSEKGLDSVIGRDIAFSKGQWQRFVLARMLVHQECPVWILDEPTSSLDAFGEKKILQQICAESNNKIILVVTHRLSYAQHMDQIIHLVDGRISCAGDLSYMLSHDAEFRKEYEAQQAMYRNETSLQ